MRSVSTRTQLREAQRKKVPIHFLSSDFHRTQRTLENFMLYQKRAHENRVRYGTSEAPSGEQHRCCLLKLPPELLLMTTRLFDLTEPAEIDDLASFAQTCKSLKKIVLDKTNLQKSLEESAPLPARVLSPTLDWSTLQPARDLARYTGIHQQYISAWIEPYMEEEEAVVSGAPTDIPTKGWEDLLRAGALIRAKFVGLKIRPVPNMELIQALTPAELMVLMYSALTFQGSYDVRPETTAEFIDLAGSGWNFFKVLRSAYMMGGPRLMLNMRGGVKGLSKRFPGLTHDPSSVFSRIAEPETRSWERRLGTMAPEAFIRTSVETGLRQWYRDGVLEDNPDFQTLGIGQEGAESLRDCLVKWSAQQNPDRLPWNWENI